MPVISNTSPLLNLAIVEHLFLLPQQFDQIYIPAAVLTELKINEDLPGSRALQVAINEGWLISQAVENTALVSLLQRDLHQANLKPLPWQLNYLPTEFCSMKKKPDKQPEL